MDKNEKDREIKELKQKLQEAQEMVARKDALLQARPLVRSPSGASAEVVADGPHPLRTLTPSREYGFKKRTFVLGENHKTTWSKSKKKTLSRRQKRNATAPSAIRVAS